VRAPGVKCTARMLSLEGGCPWVMGSIHTSPVNRSAGPLLMGFLGRCSMVAVSCEVWASSPQKWDAVTLPSVWMGTESRCRFLIQSLKVRNSRPRSPPSASLRCASAACSAGRVAATRRDSFPSSTNWRSLSSFSRSRW
jgi:hypothetical protein